LYTEFKYNNQFTVTEESKKKVRRNYGGAETGRKYGGAGSKCIIIYGLQKWMNKICFIVDSSFLNVTKCFFYLTDF